MNAVRIGVGYQVAIDGPHRTRQLPGPICCSSTPTVALFPSFPRVSTVHHSLFRSIELVSSSIENPINYTL
ncbi:unnamed protein product [Nippostrongylus brasiliensis]|uniref:Uncharacterized protein n=1 Tax=Nippostrongylus brasiliensis TaxID=27835 RepID=A0A0N4Y7Z7_NIPBR|nr:unnamed protein product [Nippostrongylus brasiliensis]